MAELILSALLPFVIEKVASSAFKKVASFKQIKPQLKKLETRLPQIRALLNDAAEKEIQDRNVKDWLKRLQHLVYDIDDVLDSLATDAIHKELTGGITRRVRKVKKIITNTFSSSKTEMHEKLNDITTKLQQLYDEKTNLGLEVKHNRSKNLNRSYQTSLLPPGIDIVGRQSDKEIILHKLLADHEPHGQNKFSVVPIVGMGGLGKTTLARLLYNEPKVEEHFEIKAWVCVSDEFDCFNISKVIYEAAGGEKKKFADLNLLQVDLKKQLAGKRFLLVLDDVWTDKIKDWDSLVPPFGVVAPGSKIVITTRKTQLLQRLGDANPYHLDTLSDDDALSLFAQHALGATNFDSYPIFRPYGEAIVQKCDGLPLALKSLGSLLRTRKNEEDWKELVNSKIWRLEDGGGILPALRLSYHELSACLKQLFAYSCLFPKDYVFEKEDLILLWMAEGFLHESIKGDSVEMERLGEKFFDELLSKSFFEYANDEKTLFVMHDLMNDLATSVAGEFFVRLDIGMKNKIEERSVKKYRHMSFVREEFMTFKKFEAFERANSLRTFLAVSVVSRDNNNIQEFHLANKILNDLLPRLPLLRVLSLSNLQIDEVPEAVGDLKHLRYLNLSQNPITHLPDNICNLYNLQTLMVIGCHHLRKFPDNFSKLTKLRHLDIWGTRLLENMPVGIGEMKSLQTLSKIGIRGENDFPMSGLKNLKNIRRRVYVHGLDKLQNNDQTQEASLSQMRPSELVLEWSDVFDDFRNQRVENEVLNMNMLKPHSDNLKKLKISAYGGIEFPKWVGDSCFSQLTEVSIMKCRNCKILPPLGQLQLLKKLSIESMDDVKEVGSELLGNGSATFLSLEVLRFGNMPRWEVWSVNAVGGVAVFPCLKELHIEECPNLARWEVWSANADVGVFPCLEELWIKKCPNLVDLLMETLPSLRDVTISDCGEGVLESLVGVASSSLTELVIRNISGGVSGEFTCKVSLPLLKVLSIYNCGEGVLKSVAGAASSSLTKLSIRHISGLSDEVWGGVEQSLGALDELEISECNEIRNLWESEEKGEACGKKVLVNLQKLGIYGCLNLVRIGGGKENDGSNLPTSLRMLKIIVCRNLKHLSCPGSIETLEIRSCRNLVRIGGGKENDGSNLPTSLRMLKIEDCDNLKHLSCPGSIETLEIWFCKNLEHLSCPGNNIQELKITNCSSIKYVSFPTEEVGGGLKKLKSLEIRGSNSEELEKELEKQVLNTNIPMLEEFTIWKSQYLKSITKYTLSSSFTQQLTSLKISLCQMIIEAFPDLHNLTSLKDLVIRGCPGMEGPPPSSSVSVGVWPPKLESLEIGWLKRPISEWGPLPNSLVHLTLYGGFGGFGESSSTEEDIKSFPTSSSLLIPSPSLVRLELFGFEKMERMSSEGLQHLTSLQHLYIQYCPELKELPEKLLPSLLSLEIVECENEELKEKMTK